MLQVLVFVEENVSLGVNNARPTLQVHRLSAYEFARHYHFKTASHPQSEQAHAKHLKNPGLYHAQLTEEGLQKVATHGRGTELVPGNDYRIRAEGGEDWVCLGEGEHVNPAYRHDWVVLLRRRPNVPVPYGAQGSKSEEEQAMKLLILFFPWVNDIKDASPAVPYIGNFWQEGATGWRQVLRIQVQKFGGFPTEEVRRFVIQFCMTYFLPRGMRCEEALCENSDNEDVADDLDVVLGPEDLDLATLTRVRGAGSKAPDEAGTPTDGEEGADALGMGMGMGTEGKPSKLFDLTMDMFRISGSIWLAPDRSGRADPAAQAKLQQMLEAGQVQDHALARRAATASKKGEHAHEDKVAGLLHQEGRPRVRKLSFVTKQAVEEWLNSERIRKLTNPKQKEFLELMAEQVMVEAGLITEGQAKRKSSEPLIWLLHGPPGTGKSHVLFLLREFFDQVVGYMYGLDYEVAAYQAVNAADLQGKTMHKAFGWKKYGEPASEAAAREAHKRMAVWRWLILDEISLVDAKLLGQAERDLREVKAANDQWKTNRAGVVRPFGGINVIFTGDFHQLPPPAGIYLADVPRSLLDPSGDKPAEHVLADYGKELFWKGTVQGITELEERERCKDHWWNEVVDQKRAGQLSDSNWRYLHGFPVEGCTLSEEERLSRQRVITSFADPRLQEEKFKHAMAVVANNDARYQINKDRAKRYSQEARTPLYWSAAQDTASTPALQEADCSHEAKIRRVAGPYDYRKSPVSDGACKTKCGMYSRQYTRFKPKSWLAKWS